MSQNDNLNEIVEQKPSKEVIIANKSNKKLTTSRGNLLLVITAIVTIMFAMVSCNNEDGIIPNGTYVHESGISYTFSSWNKSTERGKIIVKGVPGKTTERGKITIKRIPDGGEVINNGKFIYSSVNRNAIIIYSKGDNLGVLIGYSLNGDNLIFSDGKGRVFTKK